MFDFVAGGADYYLLRSIDFVANYCSRLIDGYVTLCSGRGECRRARDSSLVYHAVEETDEGEFIVREVGKSFENPI